MEDEELLVFAAKAAGMPEPVDEHGIWSAWVGTLENGHWWNPLDDDGDALRLSVYLGILLRTDFIKLLAQLMGEGMEHGEAARRAIVRIAAEIGSSKP